MDLQTPERHFREKANLIEDIEQIYLVCNKKQSFRARKIYKPVQKKYKYTATFKQQVGKKTVEIETKIDSRDYRLLKKEAKIILTKTRCKIGDWEVDFFKENNKIYFVQAEIEMPENQKKPDFIPDFITKNLIYIVKKGDGRFSSKRLGNSKHAQRLLNQIHVRS